MGNYVDTSKLVIVNGRIDWMNSVGRSVKFRYKKIEDEVVILGYEKNKVTIYNEIYGEYKIHTQQFKKCRLSCYLFPVTKEYKYNIGDVIGKIEIISLTRKDRNRYGKPVSEKAYVYKCNVCGNIDTLCEYNLNSGKSCNVCCINSPRKAKVGFNDVATVRPDLIKYFENEEIPKKYTIGSNSTLRLICPNCGYEKNMKINTLQRQGFCCNMCSTGKSYGETFVKNMFIQYGIDFDVEKTFEWSENVYSEIDELCGSKRYDFVLEDIKLIIEVHGAQHYEEKFTGGRSLEHEIENDKIKKSLALNNGYHYCVIDVRKSSFSHIVNSITESLSYYFDFKDFDFIKCEENTRAKSIKPICDMYNEGLKVNEIARIEKISSTTVKTYLKQGNVIGMCDY